MTGPFAQRRRKKKRALARDVGAVPAIVLVRPQLGENIGAAARAMLNCGLNELRLVNPKNGWPSEYAVKAASGADAVLDAATLHESTAAAIADLTLLYATTARRRDMVKPILTPRAAAASMRAAIAAGNRVGVLFGPERTGLHNDEIALAEAVIEVPLHPVFTSLNLAQAVLLIGYEWFQAGIEPPPEETPLPGTRRATSDELMGLFEHLERELDDCGFLLPVEKRPAMVRNLRNMLHRAGLTEQEVRTLRGVITGLTSWHQGVKRKRPK
jgi:tRNA/rRNA methyltransferase